MDGFYLQENFEKIKKYIIYFFILVGIIIAIFIALKLFENPYKNSEKLAIKTAEAYVKNNNIVVTGELYIPLEKLPSIDNTDLCKTSSGVIVTRDKGNLKYQAYLKCDDYETKIVNNKGKIIELVGDPVIILNNGELFKDPLYILKDEARVEIISNVTTKPGIYTVKYCVYVEDKLQEIIERRVIVSESDKEKTITGLINKEVPVLKLIGDKNIYLSLNSKYKEPGYKAYDYKDGKISRNVEVTGKVDSTKIGTYTITYKVTNSRGTTVIETRNVSVMQKKANFDITLESSFVENKAIITLNISGDEYNYSIDPTGTRCIFKTCTSEVKSNGIYRFKIYDTNGNEYISEIEIDGIDDEAPTGTCTATVTSKKGMIVVSATDNKGIGSYTYIIDGSRIENQKTNVYEVAKEINTASVEVKDISGNTTKLTCDVEIKKVTSDMSSVTMATATFPCKAGSNQALNDALKAKVNAAGRKTRAGVVAAATYLAADLGYRIEYFWAGKYAYEGLNPNWGCEMKWWDRKVCSQKSSGDTCIYGMDCTGFTKWAFVNAGFDASLIPRSSQQSSNWGTVKPAYFTFDSPSKVEPQPGDILYTPGHVGLIIGVDDKLIKLAQLTPRSLSIDFIYKDTGKSVDNKTNFTGFVALDEFYQTYGE
jgi:cell wall-associated NlpC family hydrolase